MVHSKYSATTMLETFGSHALFQLLCLILGSYALQLLHHNRNSSLGGKASSDQQQANFASLFHSLKALQLVNSTNVTSLLLDINPFNTSLAWIYLAAAAKNLQISRHGWNSFQAKAACQMAGYVIEDNCHQCRLDNFTAHTFAIMLAQISSN